MTRPNGISTNYQYDSLSRLLSVLHQAGSSTIDGASYTLDAAGNRTAKTDDLVGVTSNYTYDKICELTQVTQGASTTESYNYDPAGKRTASLGVSSYTNNTSNELTSDSNASYTYDSNGNTTSKTDSNGTTNYTWDYEDRLTQVTLPSTGGTVTFKYDPFGRRIEKISPTTTSIFVYDGDNLVQTVNSTGGLVARYTQTTTIDEPLAMQRGGTNDYYEQDGLGSVTSLTATNGSIVQSYTYDSFGNTTASTGSLRNYFQYTGREFDTETNLYYYRARNYDPSAGRFTSEDTSKFAALDFSLYSYVGNGATNFKDPTGFVRIDPGFPKNCLSNLNRAIQILRRAAQMNPKCNCQYTNAGGPRTLQQLLDTPDITVHYNPVQNNNADPEENGIAVGYTLPGDTSNIWLYPYACRMGRWTIASNLAHEFMHISLTPGLGQEDAARQAQLTCGFTIQVLSPTIIVRP